MKHNVISKIHHVGTDVPVAKIGGKLLIICCITDYNVVFQCRVKISGVLGVASFLNVPEVVGKRPAGFRMTDEYGELGVNFP